MSVYKRQGSRYWWCKFQIRGKEYQLPTGKVEKREAEAEERRLRSQAETEAPPARRRGVGPLYLLADADIERAVREGADEVSETRTLESRWAPMLSHFGRERDIATITLTDIDNYVSARRRWVNARGKVVRISGQTITRELAALKRAYVIAKRSGWVTKVPDADDWPRIKRDPPNVALAGKLRSPEVLRRLLADATDRRVRDPGDSADTTVRDHLLFCVLTGVRWGELARVTAAWFEEEMINAPARSTKTRKSRYVAATPEVLEVVERRKKVTPEGGCLFPHKSLGQWLRRYCARIGVKPAITLRDLRHTYSTLGMAGTGDATAVQASMGHADLATTQRYQHSTIARASAVGVAVAQAVFGTARESKPQAGTEEPVQEEDEPAKVLILQSARLAQLDRALVSESMRIVDFADLFCLSETQIVQQNPVQSWPALVQLAGTAPAARYKDPPCERHQEVMLHPSEWLRVSCNTCGGEVDTLEGGAPSPCPLCGGSLSLERAAIVVE